MSDIKQRLLDAADESPEYRDMCNVAHDHITAQEKRIAEMEAQIAVQAGRKPFAWIDEFGQLVVLEKFIKQHIGYVREDGAIPDSWHPIFKHPAPADAIDAERYRWLRDTLMSSFAGGVEVNDEKLSYQSSDAGEEVRVFWYPVTPVGFFQSLSSNLDDAIDSAMKAAK